MEILKKDIIIDNGYAIWDINTSEPVGGTYMGTFKFRCVLSPLQIIEADRDYRDLLGPNPAMVDPLAENLAYALSQLKQRVVQAPPFWTETQARFGGAHIKDTNVIDLALKAAFEAEIKYREELKENHKAATDRLRKALDAKYAQEDNLIKTTKELNELDQEVLKELNDLPTDTPKKKRK
jgi:hypothetical protein